MYWIYCGRKIGQNMDGIVVEDSNRLFETIDEAKAFIDGE